LGEAVPPTLFFLAAFHMIAVTKTVILADTTSTRRAPPSRP
jgi:hypothetical protein